MRGDPEQWTLFTLADRLRMTVGQLRATMSDEELMSWCAFYRIRKERVDQS